MLSKRRATSTKLPKRRRTVVISDNTVTRSNLQIYSCLFFHLFLIYVEGICQQGAKEIIRTEVAGSDEKTVEN
jgi:hypothetical protein